MSNAPAIEVVEAVERGNSQILRRAEIFEYDGETPWVPAGDTENSPRLIDGAVSVDYGRDERRTLDLTLLNDDKLLRPDPNGGFWYDKVVKIFRGVTYPVAATPPNVAIVESTTASNSAYQLRSMINSLGFTRTDVQTGFTSSSDATLYDMMVSYTGSVATAKSAMLQDFWNNGGAVVTISTMNGVTQLPFVASESAQTGIAWGVTPVAEDNPLSGFVFTTTTQSPTADGKIIISLGSGAQRVAVYTASGKPTGIAATVAVSPSGGRWFDLHVPAYSQQVVKDLLKAGMNWARNFVPYRTWEIQLGEFCIDRIDEDDFPHQVKITGRDYTKRCLTSKFEKATTFPTSTRLKDLITALANNSGCYKLRLPAMAEVLASTISVERGTPRWEIMKKAADANGYEIFFDNEGYLTMRKFQDPSFSPVTTTFKTGPEGNLVRYTRSTNDSRLYNHICIYGDPTEDEGDRLPYFGEAKNTEPDSPTRIERIGDRLYTFASTFFTSDKQAQDLAIAWLKIHALESYELSFDSIFYPWLECGEIAEVLDPDRLAIDPTRFLIDTINYPLALGPMSMSAKRVTYVGDPSSNITDSGTEGLVA